MPTDINVKVKVNHDGIGWVDPNPNPTQPGLDRTAKKGEIVQMTQAEADRLGAVLGRVYYRDPVTGVPGGAYRLEPAVIDADEDAEASAAALSEADAGIRSLEADLAQARALRPLIADRGTPPAPYPVTLSPAQGGARLIPEGGEPATAAEGTASGLPMPEVSDEDRRQAEVEAIEAKDREQRAAVVAPAAPGKGSKGKAATTPPPPPPPATPKT